MQAPHCAARVILGTYRGGVQGEGQPCGGSARRILRGKPGFFTPMAAASRRVVIIGGGGVFGPGPKCRGDPRRSVGWMGRALAVTHACSFAPLARPARSFGTAAFSGDRRLGLWALAWGCPDHAPRKRPHADRCSRRHRLWPRLCSILGLLYPLATRGRTGCPSVGPRPTPPLAAALRLAGHRRSCRGEDP